MANEALQLHECFGLAAEEAGPGQRSLLGSGAEPAARTVLAYLAGIIDGEGWIGIQQYEKRGLEQYAIRMSVTQTESVAIELLAAVFGGKARWVKRPSQPRPYWFWAIESRRAIRCLRALLPYLRVKHGQAVNALALGGLAHARGGGGRPVAVTQQMRELYASSKELNGRGAAAQDSRLRRIL